ncbi:MAG: methylated-DNA--[protein]-cysteine S-methyltransferase, partial [Planctomycetes bacterium]|nr:methylated-DNA--[protein]-cysteine S-methyltransferase [Planctomycetota bacterium]
TKEIVNRVFWPVEKEPSARQFNLVLKGTNFQLKVWQALLDIPLACAVTYEGVARRIGQPTAARAVGAAIGRNPIAYLIPCHRVIRKTGAVTDYRWGTVKKRAIIGWEAARSESELEVFAASRKRELSYHQPRKR